MRHIHRYSVSQLLQPLSLLPHNVKTPKAPAKKLEEISSKSSRLMADLGIVRPAGTGSFHYLPLAVRSIEKLTRIIDEELEQIGCQKILMPTLTPGDLWKKTKRWSTMGPELLKCKDRHEKDFVISPTHEEAVTDLLASIKSTSYRALPLKLYQISNKVRDEGKPRFGLIRTKEFLMKDLYTFDTDIEAAKKTYEMVTETYNRIFGRIGVPFVRVEGDTGNIGGSSSHEFHFPAPIGQDSLLVCKMCGRGNNVEVRSDQLSDPECRRCHGECTWEETKGIEVGHTFLLGDRYSAALKAKYLNEMGKPEILQMGCYGLGVSRILAAAIEVLSTESDLRWPDSIAPFTACIICPKKGSKEYQAMDTATNLYDYLNTSIVPKDVILDDRDKITVGGKLREAIKTGYPYVVVFGKRCVDESNPIVEVRTREDVYEIPPSEVPYFIENAVKIKNKNNS